MQNRRRASTTRKVRRYSRPVASANCGNGEFTYPEGLGLKGNGPVVVYNLGSPLGGFCPTIIVICIVSDNLGAVKCN